MMAMMNIEHQMELPTPRSMARTSYRVHVWCKACRHARDAGLGALIAAGRGDVPLIQTRALDILGEQRRCRISPPAAARIAP
jgi:hypothetical protein